MDQQTLTLLRALQAGERTTEAFAHICALLPPERTRLAAAEDRATLADISELLELWADSAPKELGAAATALAADIADADLEQAERAAQLYLLSLERAPAELEPLRKLEALLNRRGEHDRLDATLAMQAEALRAQPEVPHAAVAAILRRLGQLRAERGKDLGSAIDVYERALDLAVDMDIVRELADLYLKRAAPGDVAQAADLYCTLAEVLGPSDGIPMLDRALDRVPDHDAALDLLETYVPAAEQPSKLKARWSAYIERSGNEQGVSKRRYLLAQAHAGQGDYREAIVCLGPLIEQGDAEALRMQAAFLPNLQEQRPSEVAAGPTAPKSGNGAKVRPPTLVGFRVPAPDAPKAQHTPAKEPKPEPARDAPEPKAEPTGDAPTVRVRPARSGETLVGFQLPQGGIENAAEVLRRERELAAKNSPAAKAETATPRASVGPAAKSKQPASSPASQKPAAAARTSSAPNERASGTTAPSTRSSRPSAAAAAAKAAALKAGRTSGAPMPAPAPAPIGSTAPAKRSSVPPLGTKAIASPIAPASVPQQAQPNPEPAGVASFEPTMPAQKRPLHKDVRVIGGVSATVGILLMIALFSGSKKPPPPPTTRGEAVAPRPASEPVAAPTPSQPPPIAAPTPSKSLPSPAPEPAHSKKPSHAGPPGHLAPGKAHVVGGGLTAQQIALVLEDYLPTIEHCYADALAQKSHLQGRVVFGWTIEKNGHPSRVRTLSGTLKDDELQQCSAEAIKKARFPKPKKKTSEITWPLDYKKS